MLALGGHRMGSVFKESGKAEREVPENSNSLRTACKEASGQGFRIQTRGRRSNQDLLIFVKSNTWDSLQTRIFLE